MSTNPFLGHVVIGEVYEEKKRAEYTSRIRPIIQSALPYFGDFEKNDEGVLERRVLLGNHLDLPSGKYGLALPELADAYTSLAQFHDTMFFLILNEEAGRLGYSIASGDDPCDFFLVDVRDE